MRAVLDTSVFVARENARPLGELPDQVAVSVVTLSELRHGVLVAQTAQQRAVRLKTLEGARRLGRPLDITGPVGDELARLRAVLGGRGRRMKLMDAWIAATALANDAAVCTQDSDFDVLEEAGLATVVRV
jgi:predicted nucleic acid-binding protein